MGFGVLPCCRVRPKTALLGIQGEAADVCRGRHRLRSRHRSLVLGIFSSLSRSPHYKFNTAYRLRSTLWTRHVRFRELRCCDMRVRRVSLPAANARACLASAALAAQP